MWAWAEFEPQFSNTLCFLSWVGRKALIPNSLSLHPVFLFEKVT